MTLSRRTFLAAGAATASAFSLGLSPARAEDKFTLSSAGGSWGEYLRKVFVDDSEFAKMDMVFDQGAGDSVRLSKLIATRGDPTVSVINLLNPAQVLAAEADCVQSCDTDIVTNIKNIFPEAIAAPVGDMKNWSIPFMIAATGLVYNTNEVASRPTSWNDLWNPKYKGRIGIPDYSWNGIGWLHGLNLELGGTEDNIDPAIAALIDLRKKNGAVVVANTDQAVKMLTSGEIVMLPFFNGRAFELQDNHPIDIAYVKNSVLQYNSFLIPKGVRFKDEANRFVQNTLKAENQSRLTILTRYSSTNKDQNLPTKYEKYVLPYSVVEAAAKIDWQKVNKYRGAYLKRWTEEVLG